MLKVLGAIMTVGAVMMLAAAPLLFTVVFRGKFAGGLAVMPWTLIYCSWFGLAIVAQKYLWCAERAGRVIVAVALGLIVNVSLNLVLLPRLGLLGAVLATAAGHGVALTLIVLMSIRMGFHVHRGTWVALALPLVVCLGPWNATLVLMVVALEVIAYDRLLSREEKLLLTAGIWQYVEKLPRLRGRRAAAGE
jgi:O-antigen/teichoic acid export membrane protein